MKHVVIILLIVFPSISFSQLGVSFHQSNLPFIGVNYQVTERLRPELRIGVDNFVDITAVEAVVTYDLLKNEDYELYAGLGGRVNNYAGLVVPVGLNIYPLPYKQFGFHIEMAPIAGEDFLLRGSWGIRFRFNKRT